MGKVVKLKGPQTATVELAEKLLADCKSGVVTAFAVAQVVNGANFTSSASAFRDKPSMAIDQKLLLCAIEEMRHEFKHALRGG